MTWAGHAVPVSRTLFVDRTDGVWAVHFEDGRLFHPWTVGERVDHPCAPDHYRGLVETDGDPVTRWTVEWQATGPEKDYVMTTSTPAPRAHPRRDTRNGPDTPCVWGRSVCLDEPGAAGHSGGRAERARRSAVISTTGRDRGLRLSTATFASIATAETGDDEGEDEEGDEGRGYGGEVEHQVLLARVRAREDRQLGAVAPTAQNSGSRALGPRWGRAGTAAWTRLGRRPDDGH